MSVSLRDGRVVQGFVFEYFDVISRNEADPTPTIPRTPPLGVVCRLLDYF